MAVSFPGYRDDIPFIQGRPLLLVRCRQCGYTTVARSPYAPTVRGWELPARWPYHERQLRATVEGTCHKCAGEERKRASQASR